MHRSVSIGIDAFAAMGRSYESLAQSRGGWCIHRTCRRGPLPQSSYKKKSITSTARGSTTGRYTRGPPLVGTPRGAPVREATSGLKCSRCGAPSSNSPVAFHRPRR